MCFHALATHPTDTPCPLQYGYTVLDDRPKPTNDEVKAVLRQHGAKHSLFYAVKEKMLELVEDLIKEGADVNYKNHVSLHRVLSASVYIDVKSGQSAHALAWKVHGRAPIRPPARCMGDWA